MEGESKVRAAVEWYKENHSEEYIAFVAQMKLSRESSISDYAIAEGSPDHRMLHEMPETMWDYLLDSFTTEEITWFSEKKTNQWFAKEFPEFAVARVI